MPAADRSWPPPPTCRPRRELTFRPSGGEGSHRRPSGILLCADHLRLDRPRVSAACCCLLLLLLLHLLVLLLRRRLLRCLILLFHLAPPVLHLDAAAAAAAAAADAAHLLLLLLIFLLPLPHGAPPPLPPPPPLAHPSSRSSPSQSSGSSLLPLARHRHCKFSGPQQTDPPPTHHQACNHPGDREDSVRLPAAADGASRDAGATRCRGLLRVSEF